MEVQTTEGEVSTTPGKQNAEGKEQSQGLSEKDLAKRFLEEDRARKPATERKPRRPAAKPDTKPEAESTSQDEDVTIAEEETDAGADSAQPAKETQGGDAEPAPSPDEDEEVLSKFHPDTQARLRKRFKSLTDAKKAAESQAETIRQQASQLQTEYNRQLAEVSQRQPAAPAEASDPNDPASSIYDENGLGQLEKEAKAMIRLYERNRRKIDQASEQGQTSITLDGKEYEMDVLERGYDGALIVRDEHVPNRRKVLQQRTQQVGVAMEHARAVAPQLFVPNSPEQLQAQSIFRANPDLAKNVNAPTIIAYMTLGIEAWNAKQKAANSNGDGKKPEPAKAPNLGGGAAAPGKVARPEGGGPQKKVVQDAFENLKKTGSEKALAKFFQASQSR